MSYIYLVLAFILNSLANILLKIGASKGLVFHGVSLATITSNLNFIVGLFFFALNALFYFLALKTIPISVGYPIMVGMSLLLINSYALTALKETISPMQMLGYVLFITGMTMIFYFSKGN